MAHLKTETKALSKITSIWVPNLYLTFQDAFYLYLVMEYLPGGDLMNLFIQKDILMEHEARFYIAELVLAIEEIHSLGYIH